MIVWATSTDIIHLTVLKSPRLFSSFPCACVSVYVSLVVPFSASQSIFGFSFKTVLKPSLVTDAPIIPLAFWGVLTWTQQQEHNLACTTAVMVVGNCRNKKAAHLFPASSMLTNLEQTNSTQPDWTSSSGCAHGAKAQPQLDDMSLGSALGLWCEAVPVVWLSMATLSIHSQVARVGAGQLLLKAD